MADRPVQGDEVVVLVPRGYADKVRVDEVDEAELQSQITVRVSRERASSKVPTLGIMVK